MQERKHLTTETRVSHKMKAINKQLHNSITFPQTLIRYIVYCTENTHADDSEMTEGGMDGGVGGEGTEEM